MRHLWGCWVGAPQCSPRHPSPWVAPWGGQKAGVPPNLGQQSGCQGACRPRDRGDTLRHLRVPPCSPPPPAPHRGALGGPRGATPSPVCSCAHAWAHVCVCPLANLRHVRSRGSSCGGHRRGRARGAHGRVHTRARGRPARGDRRRCACARVHAGRGVHGASVPGGENRDKAGGRVPVLHACWQAELLSVFHVSPRPGQDSAGA